MQDQIIRCHEEEQFSIRRISQALGVSRNTVRRTLRSRDLPKDSKDPSQASNLSQWSESIDWNKVIEEVGRGIPIKTIYKEQISDPKKIEYRRFWRELRRKKPNSQLVSIRLEHVAAERMYFDFCDGIDVADPTSGLVSSTELFVGVLPFSSYTVAEFVLDQKKPTLMRAIEHSFQKIGGVTPYIVVDNLKSAVHRANLYDPDLNPDFVEFANHWGFATLPARPYRPKDKAAVEAGIGVIQRQFFSKVRDQVFTSLLALNQALAEFLCELNQAPMKDHGNASRSDRFKNEVSLLKPLAQSSFEPCTWHQCKVHSDCHIQINHRFYSVPHPFVGQRVRARTRSKTVEIFTADQSEAIATHSIPPKPGQRSTNEAHYPSEKLQAAGFEVKAATKWANSIGPSTAALIDKLLSPPHPLKNLRRVQGILALSKKVSAQAMEYAAELALKHHKNSYFYFKSSAQFFHATGNPKLRIIQSTAPNRNLDEIFINQTNLFSRKDNPNDPL